MFNKPTRDQALALAAVFQSCYLVDTLANTGDAPSNEIKLSMAALLKQNPSSLDDIYGPAENLQMGMEAIKTLLGERQKSTVYSLNCLTYALSVLSIERQLNSRPEMLETVADGIDNAKRQAEHFSLTHDNVFANLASLYQQSISKLRQRIQVKGNAIYLQQPNIAERIRCLLFSAVRSAVLWRQLGGRKYHLVLYRKAIIAALKD
jgi:high frequency lysogenization protein